MDLVFLSLCAAMIVYTSNKVSVQSIIKLWREQGHIVYKFQDGCDGGHLGKKNGTITAILNLNVAWMHTTKCSVENMSSLHLQDDGLTS